MIFPILAGLVAPLRAPFTFFLLMVNLFVFVATYDTFVTADEQIENLLRDDSFLDTQGMAFASMIGSDTSLASPVLSKMSEQALSGDKGARRLLGSLAMRNVVFMSTAERVMNDQGDSVALTAWKSKFQKLKALQSEHPSYTWGVSHAHNGWMQWMTYQFSHSGFAHLFWNMVFLMIFGCFIETELGGSFVMIAYVGGGLAGAFAFSHLSGISASPLVGASAAISGLIGLVAFAWMKRGKIKFFYWLLPLRGYFGFVLLPSWVVFIVTLVPDFSGYLSTSPDLGSVAYAAHIGGAAWGGLMAIALSFGVLHREEAENPKDESSNQKAA